jgi:hypothetical protein
VANAKIVMAHARTTAVSTVNEVSGATRLEFRDADAKRILEIGFIRTAETFDAGR